MRPLWATGIWLLALAWLLCPRPASAYIDPGMGSLAFQTALAAAFGLAYTLRTYVWHVLRAVGRVFHPAPPDPPSTDAPQV